MGEVVSRLFNLYLSPTILI